MPVSSIRLWQAWRREHPRAARLPPILPVVLYHGRRPWRGPRRLSELVEVPRAFGDTLRSAMVDGSFLLIDLAAMQDAAIERTAAEDPLAAAALLLMKHIRDADWFARCAPRPGTCDASSRGPRDDRHSTCW